MNSRSGFIEMYKKTFPEKNTSNIIFDMGGCLKGKARIKQVSGRFKEIADTVFLNKDLWLVLAIWDVERGTKDDLMNCGFSEELADLNIRGDPDDGVFSRHLYDREALEEGEVLYLRYRKYTYESVEPIVKAIAGYELGFQDSANITAYFLSFEGNPVLLNLYDDRGMELLSPDRVYLDAVADRFKNYLHSRNITA